MRMESVSKPLTRPVILFYAMAFWSGAAALAYQVAWAKMLALTFGSTAVAAAVVIAAFMGGLGLGAWAYRWAQQYLPRPALLYACFELGIAGTTALLSRTFYFLPQIISFGPNLNGFWSALANLAAVFALLALPTALMGATFPALCSALIQTAPAIERRLGAIYGLNTLGAALGALATGLVLIENLGLLGSVNAANGVNLFIGLGAVYLAVRERGVLGQGQVKNRHRPRPCPAGRWA